MFFTSYRVSSGGVFYKFPKLGRIGFCSECEVDDTFPHKFVVSFTVVYGGSRFLTKFLSFPAEVDLFNKMFVISGGSRFSSKISSFPAEVAASSIAHCGASCCSTWPNYSLQKERKDSDMCFIDI
jgi:hypothetical protein